MTSELATVDRSAVSVVSMLEHAKSWLATAVETTGPAEIALAKAQIVTAETYARELNLSKEIRMDATEMVRRAEYALGKSIRKGQEAGTIRTLSDNASVREFHRGSTNTAVAERAALPVATDIASAEDLYGNGTGAMAMAVAEPQVFEDALGAAKAEGNLSRANVVRKVRQAAPATRDARADLIDDLAQQGYSSRQMPSKLGVSEETVREIARAYSIEIPADRSIGKTRRHDSTRIAAETVIALEGLVMGVELIDYDVIDPEQASQWADSLKHSLEALARFRNQIRKAAQ